MDLNWILVFTYHGWCILSGLPSFPEPDICYTFLLGTFSWFMLGRQARRLFRPRDALPNLTWVAVLRHLQYQQIPQPEKKSNGFSWVFLRVMVLVRLPPGSQNYPWKYIQLLRMPWQMWAYKTRNVESIGNGDLTLLWLSSAWPFLFPCSLPSLSLYKDYLHFLHSYFCTSQPARKNSTAISNE